jgi:release factor glutamine methyltransferase
MVAAVLPTLMSLLQKSADYLKAHGIGNARREAEWIFAEALGLSRLELYTRFDMPVEEVEVVRLRLLVQRRGRREPLAYVLGNQEFCHLRLTVGPGVLVPRPETEELIGLVLAELPPGVQRLLDVGTGSGAIALALMHARSDCTVEATDISEAALGIARANASRLELAVTWHQGHLAREREGGYAAVVANLPYIGEDERAQCDPELAFEPQEALFCGADGLGLIRELIADSRRLLAPGGLLWLEHGWQQGAAITALCREQGLACSIHRDLAGRDRFARIAPAAGQAAT